ncbi:TolC family protein [uncultured Mediterranea sp.]|uniref:TolC family protein n=1 Tax=uncultured Mediterranea sp. TaxID=1926662 RepID=UPI002805A4E4|nr:TolC family protein [uncultured Mediterranea sp.]
MDELFSLADKNSKSIRLHQLVIREAEQGIKVARNAYLPSLSVKAEATYIGDGCMTDRDFSNGVHADMPHWGNSFVVKAQQTLYAGGSIQSSVRRSKLQKQAAEQTHLDNRQDLRFLLAGYYLDLFQLRNQERVYRKNIEQTHLLVKDMQAAYQQGTALKSDITRYELQLQNLELGLTSTINRLNVLNHQLVTTIELPVETRIVPDTLYLKQLIVDDLQENEWKAGMNDAPSLKLTDIDIALGKNQKRLIQAERLPHITFSATNDFNGPILVEVPPLNNNFTYWFVGVGVSYNLDALFKSKRKLRQADIAIQRLEEKRRLTEEELENSIHKAYINLQEAYIRLRTQQKSVQLAHENFDIVRQRYMNGLALITDMLDASNTQLDMELQLANYQVGILYQYFLLKRQIGTL